MHYYRLESQNDSRPLNDHEMLACIIEEAGKLNRHDVTHLLRYSQLTSEPTASLFSLLDEVMARIKADASRQQAAAEHPGFKGTKLADGISTKVFNRKKCRRSDEHSSDVKSTQRGLRKKSKPKKANISNSQSVKNIPARFLRVSDSKCEEKEPKRLSTSRNFRLKSRDEIAKSIAQSSPKLKSGKHHEPLEKPVTPASYFSLSTIRHNNQSKKSSDVKKRLNESKSSKHSKCASIQSAAGTIVSKFKMNSMFLRNMKKSSNPRSAERSKQEAADKIQVINDGSQSGRLVRLTVNTGKNSGAPLVQINNILGDVSKVKSGALSKHDSLKKACKEPTGAASDKGRSRSRKSPSIEIATDHDRLKVQSLLKKSNAAYDKQAIASYLRKNRLVNV